MKAKITVIFEYTSSFFILKNLTELDCQSISSGMEAAFPKGKNFIINNFAINMCAVISYQIEFAGDDDKFDE